MPLVVDTVVHGENSVNFKICGAATGNNINKIASAFRAGITTAKHIVIDFSETCAVDARFLGLLLMLTKRADCSNTKVNLVGLSSELKRHFRLNGAEFLLDPDIGTETDAMLGIAKASGT